MKKKFNGIVILGGDSDPRKQAALNPYSPKDDPGLRARPMLRTSKLVKYASGGGGYGGPGGSSGGTSGQAVAQSPLYYDYRWSSPDKFYFPKNRIVANSIWREIYRRDAAVSIATDMYAELPWSEFDLVGIEDNEIKKFYTDMFSELNIVPKLMGFTRDFLIQGELVLHTLFNSRKGYWERVIPHNPDYIHAEGLGLAAEQPLLWLRPTPEIKKLINSPDPRVRKLQSILPREIINCVRMNKEIPLDALNTTFIPRLNSTTDIRGNSLYTRLFRVVMYEDFVVNASLAVAQRHAAPLRIFKMGDPNTGWLPSEDDESAFAEMLSMAEADPMAAIITHHNVTCELVGISDKVLLISREWDFIERMKLLALGVAKSFLVGETSFACFEAGTPVLLTDGTPAPIESIKVGDKVLDQFGKPRRVINNWCEGTPEELLEVTVWGGNKFRVTPNHRFPAWMWPTECTCGCGEKVERTGRAFSNQKHAAKLSHCYKSNPCVASVHAGRHRLETLPEGYNPERVVQAKELRRGDFLKIPKLEANNIIDTSINEDKARLLGYYLAEGSIAYGGTSKKRSGPSAVYLSFGLHELNTWVADVKNICSRLNIRTRLNIKKTSNSCTIALVPKDKKVVAWFILNAGTGASTKKLSEEVMLWPDNLIKEVLRGYFRGDGCRNDKPSLSQTANRHVHTLATVQAGTISKQLVPQLILLLARLGFPAGWAKAIEKRPNRHDYYILRIQGKAAKDLCKLVWEEELNAVNHKSTVWSDDKFLYLPIRSIKRVKNEIPVYNLEVEESHTYLVGTGIATCNSSIAGLQTLMERLASLRNKFQQDWIIRKLIEPIAKMHGFYKRPQAEIEHRIRVKDPEDMELMIPKIKWHKSLETSQEVAILNVWRDMKDRGILSDRTWTAGAGVDLDVERKNQSEERTWLKENAEEIMKTVQQVQQPGAGGAGGKPGGLPKPTPAPGGAPKPTLPEPLPLPGASLKRKSSESDVQLYYELEEELSNLADDKNKADIDEILVAIRNRIDDITNRYASKNLENAEQIIPAADSSLLSGL